MHKCSYCQTDLDLSDSRGDDTGCSSCGRWFKIRKGDGAIIQDLSEATKNQGSPGRGHAALR